MKHLIITAAFALSLSGLAFAQPSPSARESASTERGAAASDDSVSATCKDGTPYSGKSMRGACRGHGGVDKDKSATAGDKDRASGSMKSESRSDEKSSSAKKEDKSSMAAGKEVAAGGGAGKVWANEGTKVYHCSGDRYYGKTKKGEYMTETDAKSKGYRPDHGKACGA